jgi:hypothetical protein
MDNPITIVDQLQQQIDDTKINAWANGLGSKLPLTLSTDKGKVTFDSINTSGSSIILIGSSDYLPKDFFPWTITNPPLMINSDSTTFDVIGVLTKIVESM